MKMITEIVKFMVSEDITKEELVEIVDDLETKFHFKQKGYIDTELLFDEKENQWIMIQHWDTIEHLKNASSQMFQEASTESFRKALITQTVKISSFPVIKNWSL